VISDGNIDSYPVHHVCLSRLFLARSLRYYYTVRFLNSSTSPALIYDTSLPKRAVTQSATATISASVNLGIQMTPR
jgi:hypothetical protein